MYAQIPMKKCVTINSYGPPLYNHSSTDAASQIGYKCSPIALDNGTTAPVIMLFPYRNDPDTGSRIPSMSTGGAAMNAIMYTVVAVNTLYFNRFCN